MKDVWKEWLLHDFTEGSFPDVTVIVSSNGVPSAVFSVDFSPVSGRWEWTSNVTVFLSTEKRKVTHLTTSSESRLDLTIDSTNINVFHSGCQNFSQQHFFSELLAQTFIQDELVMLLGLKPFVMKHLPRQICRKGSHKEVSWREGVVTYCLHEEYFILVSPN